MLTLADKFNFGPGDTVNFVIDRSDGRAVMAVTLLIMALKPSKWTVNARRHEGKDVTIGVINYRWLFSSAGLSLLNTNNIETFRKINMTQRLENKLVNSFQGLVKAINDIVDKESYRKGSIETFIRKLSSIVVRKVKHAVRSVVTKYTHLE